MKDNKMMRNGDKTKILFIWNPYFSSEENLDFEGFTHKLLEDYNSQLIILTADKIEKKSFDNIIAAIVFSDSAHTILTQKIIDLRLEELPTILSIVSKVDTSCKDIRAFPTAKTVGKLLAKALFKKEGKDGCTKITSFFLPSETAKICANAFEESLKWLYPQIASNIIICGEDTTEESLMQYKEKIDAETCIVIYGYDVKYNKLLNMLVAQKPKQIISEFNTPDSLVNIPYLSYVCFEVPLTGIALFKKIAQTLLDTLCSYIEGIDQNISIEQQRKELHKLLLEQSRFRKTPLGTFHFTENNDFFCPFYLKRGDSDRVELIEGTESPAEVAVTALSECNKWLDKFTYSTENDAFKKLLANISIVLKSKLFCKNFAIISRKIRQWYPNNLKDWEFMIELPYLFDNETFWGGDNKNGVSIKKIQVSLNDLDIEDFAAYRIYINNNESFVEYLHSDKSTSFSLTIAKSKESKGIKTTSSKEKKVKLFIDKLKRKCREIRKDINYIYFIFLRQEQEKQNLRQHVCYCFLTEEKLGVFELTILENITIITNHTILEVAYKNELLKESIKSAKAAIMSRNMSHNLGSHYIANTKNYISNIARVKNDQDLRGLSHLLQYIQERMDYIATVISNDVYPLGALNFKSQIFDELTIDDCGERHGKEHLTTNFLLKYIVFSEKYSRTDNNSSGLKDLIIEVHYPEADSEVKVFTGTQQLYREETSLKLELSKLNIAVPCGVMARHALFNIIENIIRNSAKHNRNSTEDLKIRIALKKKNAGRQLEISIYDNKSGYETLIGENKDGTVAKRLKSIRFLEQDGSGLNKENKGLKEMIISALWLKNEDVGEVMSKIDSIVDGEKKYKLITEKCLQIKNEGGNLAYILTLPIFKEVEFINNSFKPNDLKCVCADVIVGNEDKSAEFDKPFDDIFTRYLIANDAVNSMTEVEKLKKTIYDNLHVDVDKCEIYIDANREVINYKGNNVYAKLPSAEMNDKQICFITHFDSKNDSDKKEFINKYKDVAYLDSISGENFTSTIIAPEFLNDEYLKCKVIESALTKIAIIDERIYEKFAKSDKQKQMSKEKGVRSFVDNSACTVSSLIEYLTHNFPSLFAEEKDLINNLLKEEKKEKRIDESDVDIALNILFPGDLDEKVLKKRGIFIYTMEQNVDNDTVLKSISGRESKLGNKEKLAVVHFLSIHLGLIEKYKNSGGVKKLMDNIKDLFPNVKYIAIHSGRGNFSADLSTELKDYSFITLSALEAAINNSKYMLSQLFYNMNYYGKGNLNND